MATPPKKPADKATDGIVSVHPKDSIKGPPGEISYHNLIEPDEKYKKCSANFHFTEAGKEALLRKMDAEVAKLMPVLAEEAKRKDLQAPSATDWWDESVKQPSEKMVERGQSLEWIRLGLKFLEGISKRTQKPYRICPRAWDLKGNLLDLPSLNLGWGTVAVPVIEVGLYIPAKPKGVKEPMQPAISLKLIGIQIAKLKRFSGGVGALEDDETLKMLDGQELDADLSAFLAKSDKKTPGEADEEAAHVKPEDDLPF